MTRIPNRLANYFISRIAFSIHHFKFCLWFEPILEKKNLFSFILWHPESFVWIPIYYVCIHLISNLAPNQDILICTAGRNQMKIDISFYYMLCSVSVSYGNGEEWINCVVCCVLLRLFAACWWDGKREAFHTHCDSVRSKIANDYSYNTNIYMDTLCMYNDVLLGIVCCYVCWMVVLLRWWIRHLLKIVTFSVTHQSNRRQVIVLLPTHHRHHPDSHTHIHLHIIRTQIDTLSY